MSIPQRINPEEPFILAKGFRVNDTLIALGISVLSLMLFLVPAEMFAQVDSAQDSNTNLPFGFFWPTLLSCGGGSLVFWGLSEYLIRRRKFLLPSKNLVFSIAVLSCIGSYIALEQEFYDFLLTWANDDAGDPKRVSNLKIVAASLVPIAVLGLYYWRFKLPFALLLVAIFVTRAVIFNSPFLGIPIEPSFLFPWGMLGFGILYMSVIILELFAALLGIGWTALRSRYAQVH